MAHSRASKALLIFPILLHLLVLEVPSFEFGYSSFTTESAASFVTLGSSDLARNALQVTYDSFGSNMANLSGRILFKNPVMIYNKNKNITSSFNSTFVMNISPVTNPHGEGMAFVIAHDNSASSMPSNSYGQWLGIVNGSTNGSTSNNILAVEFDTLKSNETNDIDGNHVGLNLNSINSVIQVPLSDHGVTIASGNDVVVTVFYNGTTEVLNVSVFMLNDTNVNKKNHIISYPIDLSDYLPEDVYVGFSASTGAYTQLNCIKSWTFSITDVGDQEHRFRHVLVWIVVPSVILIVILIVSYLALDARWRKMEQMSQREDYPELERAISMSASSPQKCHLKELKQATNNFSSKNKLGEGGFGTVYKGILNDKEVAVKRISKDSRQGKQEFLSEITIIGNLHHKNLVKLVGWCYENNELILVYEFMPNGSLDKLIFNEEDSLKPLDDDNSSQSVLASTSMRSVLNWETRFNIICGVAQALDYLHSGCERRVLHRDIKPSNIMLDADFTPKLGDFGLARTLKTSDKTHHSTKEIAGTPGYMAPEIFHTGHATAETDVYAFGIVLLEVSSGRKLGLNDRNQVVTCMEWIWELHRKEKIIDGIDSKLDKESSAEHKEQMEYVLILGLACCHPNPYQRPSIRTVMQVLTGEATPLDVPVEKPTFMWPATHASFSLSTGSPHTGGELAPFSVITGR